MSKRLRNMGPIEFEVITPANNYYHCPVGNGMVTVERLIELAEGLEVYDMDVRSVHIGCTPFGLDALTPYSLAHHAIRVGSVDITKPVIVNADGYIMDGWHRIARALIDGRTHIPAKRFTTLQTFDN